MENFIKNILSFEKPGKYENEECVFINDSFVVVKDLKMKSNETSNLHLTAWCKNNNLTCLNDLNKNHVKMLLDIRNDMSKYIQETYNFEDYEVFIHYPPQFYNLHIHFRNKNLEYHAPIEEVYLLDDVIKNICNQKEECKL